MKRRLLIRIPVFFLIGILVSYAVAWGCTVSRPGGVLPWFSYTDFTYRVQFSSAGSATSVTPIYLSLYYRSNVGKSRCGQNANTPNPKLRRAEGIGEVISIELPTRDLNNAIVWKQVDDHDVPFAMRFFLESQIENATGVKVAGWPLPMVYTTDSLNGSSNQKAGALIINGPSAQVFVIPYRPLIGNLILNAAIYGLIIWGFVAGCNTLIRSRRTCKGLCPKCRYDLRGDHDTGCPECGWGRATHSRT